MIPRIKQIYPKENYILHVIFDDGHTVEYDVKDDMKTLPNYNDLSKIPNLFNAFQLDESRTCVYWRDDIDLPSDIIYEYGAR